MLDTLNEQKVRNLILYIADRIIENKAYLTEVDSAIGDGDHGIGMALGMQKAKDKVAAAADCGNAYALFGLAGKTSCSAAFSWAVQRTQGRLLHLRQRTCTG